MKQTHLKNKIIKTLCESIKLMGELACYNAHGGADSDISVEYIEEHWLEYVPQCQADAYREGIKCLKHCT